ncbi:hypothetical protein [Marinobacter sp. LV10MA510-1]|uniref:hypothetical protein n=1 Tax=Marinobacter sp. LV10MA510-1 TaxID=1415567 RepID=UPI000BF8C35C|nr:hypothetical protein [Marinobacter sp. LV10MA510-1]PFG11115.1 hypothetical protein ATI45_3615 [Marinobacter sp. LV10MA510-1]
MSEQCPNCLSIRIGKNNYGKKAAGVVGASIGAYSGFTAVTAGAQTGLAIGVRAGPVGAAAGGIGGAIIGAFLGGASGASAGVVFGDVLDGCVLDNHRCLDCGYSFTADSGSKNDIR